MPKVEIIHYTGKYGFSTDGATSLQKDEMEAAARLLAFTKNTRLNMNPEGFEVFRHKPWDDILTDISYMAGTIPSNWEFVDVVFSLQKVSRACAQQITRTRFTPMDADIFGSYAMQSFRLDTLGDVTFHLNPEISEGDESNRIFLEEAHDEALLNYKEAIGRGIPQQDARGLLPMDTHCNLVVKFNLRQLVDMLRTRDQSLRVQGEYGEVAHQMKEAVLRIWPWSATFFEPKDSKAVAIIEEVAKELVGTRLTADLPLRELSTRLAKAADLLKK